MPGPSIIERQALGNLFEHITSQDPVGYGDYFWEEFSDWDPIKNASLSPYQYYSTLKSFPQHAKRLIIQGVLTGWNKHHDLNTLYQAITSLIYLKVCETSEYFLLQQIYNFLTHFKDVCDNLDSIEIESRKPNKYTLRFWKDNTIATRFQEDGSRGIIDFELEPYGEEPLLAIVPWFTLLNSYTEQDQDTKWDEDDRSWIIDELYDELSNEFAKTHCPWIQSTWDFDYQTEKFDRGIVIVMHSLSYQDNNGL